MEVKTRYCVGDCVVVIDNSKIVTLKIFEVRVIKTVSWQRITYGLIISKAVDFGSNDITVEKDEEECFETVMELAQFYQNKQ